jgi:hypothetical protein
MTNLQALLQAGNPPRPTWVRLAVVARRLGLTQDMLEAEAARGRIALRIERWGPGLIRHVRLSEALALVNDFEAPIPSETAR